MATWLPSMTLLVLGAVTTAAADCDGADLFALSVSATRNSTGHDNVKACLEQPAGAIWNLDMGAKEKEVEGGEIKRFTTITLSAEPVAAGSRGDWGVQNQLAQLRETNAQLQASNAQLSASVRDLGQRLRATQEDDRSVKRQLDNQEATIAGLRASNAALQANLQRQLADVTEALRANNAKVEAALEAAKRAQPTTPRPLTEEGRRTLSEGLVDAAAGGRVEEIRQLLARGADVHFTRDDFTPLHIAAREGQVDAIRVLLDSGANVDATNDLGNTPLHTATGGNQVAAMQALIAARANVNAANHWGWTPLHFAAKNDNQEAVRVLLAAGAAKGARNGEGQLPRDVASSHAVQSMLQ